MTILQKSMFNPQARTVFISLFYLFNAVVRDACNNSTSGYLRNINGFLT